MARPDDELLATILSIDPRHLESIRLGKRVLSEHPRLEFYRSRPNYRAQLRYCLSLLYLKLGAAVAIHTHDWLTTQRYFESGLCEVERPSNHHDIVIKGMLLANLAIVRSARQIQAFSIVTPLIEQAYNVLETVNQQQATVALAIWGRLLLEYGRTEAAISKLAAALTRGLADEQRRTRTEEFLRNAKSTARLPELLGASDLMF